MGSDDTQTQQQESTNKKDAAQRQQESEIDHSGHSSCPDPKVNLSKSYEGVEQVASSEPTNIGRWVGGATGGGCVGGRRVVGGGVIGRGGRGFMEGLSAPSWGAASDPWVHQVHQRLLFTGCTSQTLLQPKRREPTGSCCRGLLSLVIRT